MRKQFLWIDPRGAGCYYPAAGNINASAGSRGTLAIWQWPLWGYDATEVFWRLEVNPTNYMRQWEGRSLRVCSDGATWTVGVPKTTSLWQWELLVYTWDFSVPGAGVLRAYWNGVEQGTAVTAADAPVGSPERLRLGPELGAVTREGHMIHSLAVWDDVMTGEQVTALHAEGARRRVRVSDGEGELTLLATFDGRYDADVAAGGGTFVAEGAADRYCLVDDGVRERGMRRFLLGRPRHDLSDDDRVPLGMPCPLTLRDGRNAYVADVNEVNYSQLDVLAGYTQDRRVGAGICSRPVVENDGLPGPGTYRQRLHLPNDGNPGGRHIRIGPVDYVHHPTRAVDVFDQWGSGRRFTVVEDAGNGPTSFKTDLDSRYGDGHWAGADVTFVGGNCEGRRLKAVAYNSETRVLELESGLAETPVAGSLVVVDHRSRLEGCRSWGSTTHGQRLPEMNMDAWLWEFHAGSRYFTELEWQCFAPNTASLLVPNFLRYERGRTALIDGAHHGAYDNSACYGKPSRWDDNTLYCKILLERIEVCGPQTYQVLKRNSQGVGPSFADNFMLIAPTQESTKVWRRRGVARRRTRPTKVTDPGSVRGDLRASGTWRSEVGSVPIPVLHDEQRGVVTALIVGVGADGVSRLGYIEGSWDEQTGRIRWEDEAAPAGRSNPFMALSDLRAGRERDGQLSTSWPDAVLKNADGKWCLVYGAQTSHPDHFMAYLLYGADDRWSFSREEHWWEGNPIAPVVGGPDRLAPECSGFGVWANRDADWKLFADYDTKDGGRRFWGIARGKSLNHRASNHAVDLRPLIGVRGSDLRSLKPLPHGNIISPLVGPLVHACNGAVLGQSDCLGLYTDTAIAFTSGVFCFVSEDGVHFQQFAHDGEWLPRSELPGEPTRLYPGKPFRLGDRRIYYYHAGSFMNFGWTRLEGEAWYELKEGDTEGFLETPLIVRPRDGWGDLELNVSPGGGRLAVEVLDGVTEEALPGFGADEFEGAGDSVCHMARWDGKRVAQADCGTIRLRFMFSRDDPADEAPKLYAWRLREPEAVIPPRARSLRVGGRVDPTGVVDPAPELSWEYEDAVGLEQTAYHVQVASTREGLEAGIGDVWDTGQVAGNAGAVRLSGGALESNKVYYWRVRVRNSEGVWSEEW